MNQFAVNVRLTWSLALASLVFFVYGVPYGMSEEWAAGCTFITVLFCCAFGKKKLTRGGFFMHLLGAIIIAEGLAYVVFRPVSFDFSHPVMVSLLGINVPIVFGIARLARESLVDVEWEQVSKYTLVLGTVPLLGIVWACNMEEVRCVRERRIQRKRIRSLRHTVLS